MTLTKLFPVSWSLTFCEVEMVSLAEMGRMENKDQGEREACKENRDPWTKECRGHLHKVGEELLPLYSRNWTGLLRNSWWNFLQHSRRRSRKAPHACRSRLPQSPVIDGAEYNFYDGPLPDVLHHNVPCAVYYASSKAAVIMIPAKSVCPHYRSSFNCINVNPDILLGGAGNTNGALFHYVLSTCNGFQCPPYEANRALSCAE